MGSEVGKTWDEFGKGNKYDQNIVYKMYIKTF